MKEISLGIFSREAKSVSLDQILTIKWVFTKKNLFYKENILKWEEEMGICFSMEYIMPNLDDFLTLLHACWPF